MNIEEEIAQALYEAPAPGETEAAVWPPRHPGDVEWWMSRAAAVTPLVKRAQAEALLEFRQRLINRQTKQYGIVLPDVHEIVDDLDHVASCIENEGAGAHD